MGNIFENLTAALENLNKNVTKDIEEVRRCKREVQMMQEAAKMDVSGVRYVHDDNCLILSAPHIIIGNVDNFGRLCSGGCDVVIRGNEVSTEATGAPGTGGTIRNRATTIENIAVDPGIDGLENAVYQNSRISNQARCVTMQSNDEMGSFSTEASTADGINIVSDTNVNVSALAQNKGRKTIIDGKVKSLQEASKDYASQTEDYKETLKMIIDAMSKIVGSQDALNGSDDLLAANYKELYGEQHDKFKQLERLLYTTVSSYVTCLSRRAEVERSIIALGDTKKKLDATTGNFEKGTTVSHININSETVSIVSTDGDGNIRENAGAGLYVSAPHVSVSSFDKKGKLIKDSNIALNTQDFELATVDHVYNDDKRQAGQLPATGSVTITSKDVTVQAIDNELKDKKIQEKALTAGGKFSVRAENVSMVSNATDGKAAGKLTLNAKDVRIAAMDVDKEKRTDKEMAVGSTLTVLAEKTLAGSTKKSKLIQIAAENVGIIAKETAELQQDGNAVLTASGGNLTAGGSKVEVKGDTTIAGNTEIKGGTKTPKLTADQVEASSAFKSPNINDTMGAGAPAPAEKPSAKMKEEEVKG